jgi:hypothetical protein
MIVYDLDIFCAGVRPSEAHAELIVHPDAVPADAIALQRLQPISRRYPQILQSTRDLQLAQLASRNGGNIGEPLNSLAIGKGSRVSALEGLDHALIVTFSMINVKYD